jgi:hypothetical protein
MLVLMLVLMVIQEKVVLERGNAAISGVWAEA